MKDLDFDELDKAVTSLMGSVSTTDQTVKPDDDVKTLVLTPTKPLPSTDTVTATPTAPSTPTTPAPAAPSTPASSAPAAPKVEESTDSKPSLVSPAARRAGRFMDVVHPSSDMTKTTTPVSRHSGTLEPLHNDIVPDEPSKAAAPVVDVVTPAASAPSMPDLSHHATSDWPDPLDMPHAQPATDADEAPAAEDVTPDPLDIAPKTEEPLSSPFLPDAKVEKRPLGGPTPENASPSAPEANDTPAVTSEEPSSELPVPADIAAPAEVILPEELQGDLMAIESSQADTTTASSEAPKDEAPKADVPVAHAPVASVAATPMSTGPTSITQQYKAEASTGDQTNGAIYDTDSYHKPLEHPVGKKSSAALIIWIVVLLVIGAAGGAAAYFYLLK